jgi:TonB family protein
MKTTSELLLTFLLNAFWQIALVAAAAALGDWLLRRSVVRYRHFLWVAALSLSLVLPAVTSVRFDRSSIAGTLSPQSIVIAPPAITDVATLSVQTSTTSAKSTLNVSESFAIGLLALYLMFLLYRSVQLFRAWFRTQAARRGASPIEPTDRIQTIVASCQQAIGVARVSVVSSTSLRAPATVGICRPLVILPEVLIRDASDDALTAAIGHELVHVRRRDYLLNLIYEIVFLPLSFHPAATLMRRRITQTRELRCDELVAELLLQPEVYARSLVQLAGSAMPFARRARTVTVGIADADILEVRIMSLLKRTKLNVGKRRFWLVAAALLLVIPCAAAGVFAFHLNIERVPAQEPSSEWQEKKEVQERRQREEQEMKARAEREDQELRERMEKETNPEMKAKLQAILQRRQEERARLGDKLKGWAFTVDGEGAAREREQEAKQKAELARMAKISMEQAIQIAISQSPGKVLECSLVGEHWEGSGELAKPSLVLYHVVILGDESKPAAHVLVNALDGTIFKVEKEERRKEEGYALTRSSSERRAINGGTLNGKAVDLPAPEYPAIARAAHASGAVNVEITIDENGNVIAAKAVSGHPLLQAAAVSAARQASFTPTRLSGEPVKVSGVLVYNFVAQ